MEFRLLGPLEVVVGDRPLALGGRRQRAVLAILLLHANRVVSTDQLIDDLWAEEPPKGARNAVQRFVSDLRRMLDDPEGRRLQTVAPGYVLRAEHGEVDTTRFEGLAAEGHSALSAGDADAAMRACDEALDLWRGRPLEDLSYEEFAQAEIGRLEQLHLDVVADQIEGRLALGDHAALIGELEILTSEHPLRERFSAQLMLALYRSRRQADALRVFGTLRGSLRERGLEPSPELRELERRILVHDPGLEPPSPDRERPTTDRVPRPGQVITGYELRKRVGAGVLGVVYRAWQRSLEREVAIKAVLPVYADDPEFIRVFERDVQLVAQLEHPHVAPIQDFWRGPDGAFIVTRWLAGGSLVSSLERGAWRPRAALRLFEQVGAALAAAHRRGLLHRNLKPANVLLDEDGNGYLCDFAIAADLVNCNATAQPTAVSEVYDSPEQRRGEPLSPQSDLYSLAMIVYEVLTGDRPFPGTTRGQVVEGQLHHPLPPVRSRRPELPPALDGVLQKASAKSPADRYVDVSAFLAALCAVLEPDRVPTQPAVDLVALGNPYKGLQAFQEADADDFCGRDTVIEAVVSNIARSRFVAVVGPSGSGKSSIAKAGVVPALRRGAVPGSDTWFIVTMVPGQIPQEELEAALLRVAVNPPASLMEQLRADENGLRRAFKRILPDDGSELVLVVDQFEELFTLTSDERLRAHFLDCLRVCVTDPHSRLRLLVTLRADFYGRPLAYRAFGELLAGAVETVLPLTPEELERAITVPAGRRGVTCEPGLVAAIVSDVADQPGALPLLQYALTELYERRASDVLTLRDYDSIGRVGGALAQRAEDLFGRFDERGQRAARQVFLRLITVQEGATHVRGRVERSELAGLEDADAIAEVVEVFGRHRLLSFDRNPVTREPTVELAHDALLSAWGRLRQWGESAQESVQIQRRISAAAAEWRAAECDPSFLLSGNRLVQAEQWAAIADLSPSEHEREFLAASVAARRHQAQQEEARRAHETGLERRALARLRALVTVLAFATVVAVGLTLVVFRRGQEAADEREGAQEQARVATVRNLASAAVASLDVDPERSILLALRAAEEIRPDVDPIRFVVEDALHRALQRFRLELRLSPVSATGGFDPTGSSVVTGSNDGTATIWDAETGQARRELPAHDGAVVQAVFSPDGTRVATAGEDGASRLWDVQTGAVRLTLRGHDDPLTTAEFSPDGTRLATASTDGTAIVWDLVSGRQLHRFDVGVHDVALAWSPDGTKLATTDESSERASAAQWDTRSGRRVASLERESGALPFVPPSPACSIAYSPDGSQLLTGGFDGSASLWDATATGTVRDPTVTWGANAGGVCAVAFSPDGSLVATGGRDGTARLWARSTILQVMSLAGHTAEITGIAFSPDSAQLISSARDGSARVWDASVVSGREWQTLFDGSAVFAVAYSPSGSTIATTGPTGTKLWDAGTESVQEPRVLRDPASPAEPDRMGVDFSPDGTWLLTTDGTNSPKLWEVGSGEMILVLDGHTDEVGDAAFSPDGTRIATASFDGTMRTWNARTGTELLRVDLPDAVASIAYSPDGRRLLGCCVGTTARMWDAATGRERLLIDAHTPVGPVHFNPDGTLAVTATLDGTVDVWDAATGERRATLVGHRAAVTTAAFSPDGTRIATGSDDGTIKLWDTATGAEQATLPGHLDVVNGLAFSPDGTRLATSSFDLTVRVHALDFEDLLEIARSQLTRNLTQAECRQYLSSEDC